jgi:hypothetical protein
MLTYYIVRKVIMSSHISHHFIASSNVQMFEIEIPNRDEMEMSGTGANTFNGYTTDFSIIIIY